MIKPSLLQSSRGKDHLPFQLSQDFSQRDEISAEPQRQMRSQKAIRSRKSISREQNVFIERQERPKQFKSH